MSKSYISTKSLLKLKNKLPYGSITKISIKLGISKSVVSRVLNGEVNNQQVITEALEIIKAHKNLEASINQL